MHSERGTLLFKVAADRQPERYIWAVLAVCFAVVCAISVYREHGSNLGMLIFFVAYGLRFLVSRKVVFYENGIHFPPDPSGARERFIAWPQVERFHWDGDVLTIIPSTSVLTSGGGSGASALAGGTLRIPAARRAEVENLLSRQSAYSREAGT
jgi:hypothetical protein